MQKKQKQKQSANYDIARRKLELSAVRLSRLRKAKAEAVRQRYSQAKAKEVRQWRILHCATPFSVATGPRTRDQHISALSAKIDATHKALITVATGIVNLKRKLRRQEEIYRTLAHNYGSRTAEHTRQIIEASAANS